MFDSSLYSLSEQTLFWGSLAYVFGVFHFLAEPYRWFIYTKNLSENTYNSFFNIFSFTALASYMLPFKLGLPFRIYLLQKVKELNAGMVMALLVLDGLIYYAGWGIAALVGVVVGATTYLNVEQLSVVSGLAVASVGLLWFIFYKYSHYLPDNVLKKLAKVKTSLSVIRELKKSQFMMSFLVVTADIGSQIFRHYAIFMMLGVSLSLIQIAMIVCISIFTGIISMMPMGLVGYDATLILLAQQAGVPLEQALLIPLVNRFISLSLSALLGIWGGMKLGYNPFNGIKRISNLLSSNQ